MRLPVNARLVRIYSPTFFGKLEFHQFKNGFANRFGFVATPLFQVKLTKVMTQKLKASNEKSPKRATLQDIADIAGVKKMAVSNALNGTRSVAPATRERIQRIASELNYIPNFAARALTQGRTGIIAVLSGPTNEPYYGTIVHLLEQNLSAQGFHLMLIRSPGEARELINATGHLAVDGAIAVDRADLVQEFRPHPTIPCVSISSCRQSTVDNIFVDLSASVEQAIGLMLDRNRRRIAYLVTSDGMADEAETRAGAYRNAMKAAKLPIEIINVTTDDLDELENHFKAYIEKQGHPDGLLCQNDEVAMSAFQVLRELGLCIPDDVLLVGCDGQRHLKYFNPPLSTIAQPMEEICALAWKSLQRRIAQPDSPCQVATVKGRLIIRKSLGA